MNMAGYADGTISDVPDYAQGGLRTPDIMIHDDQMSLVGDPASIRQSIGGTSSVHQMLA